MRLDITGGAGSGSRFGRGTAAADIHSSPCTSWLRKAVMMGSIMEL